MVSDPPTDGDVQAEGRGVAVPPPRPHWVLPGGRPASGVGYRLQGGRPGLVAGPAPPPRTLAVLVLPLWTPRTPSPCRDSSLLMLHAVGCSRVSPRLHQSRERGSGYRNRHGQFLLESAGLSFAPSLALVFVPVRVRVWGLLTPSVLSDCRRDDRLSVQGLCTPASPGSPLHRSFWKHEQLDSFRATICERPEPWATRLCVPRQGPGGSEEPGVCPFWAGQG